MVVVSRLIGLISVMLSLIEIGFLLRYVNHRRSLQNRIDSLQGRTHPTVIFLYVVDFVTYILLRKDGRAFQGYNHRENRGARQLGS